MDGPLENAYYELLADTIIPYVFAAFLLESLLFGIQCVLFCVCLYLLVTGRNAAHLVIVISIFVMFILSVADMALSYRWILHDVPAVLKFQMSANVAVNRLFPKGYLYISNNLIADGLLTYRCYKIWNSRTYVAVAAAIFLVADSIWGYISMNTGPIFTVGAKFIPMFFWSVFAFNTVMTLATAGRIWWAARTVQPFLDSRQIKRFHTAMAIILESGAIYPITILILIAIPTDKSYRIIFLFAAIRIVCIMPTLMIVQVQVSRGYAPKAETPSQQRSLSHEFSLQFTSVPPSPSPIAPPNSIRGSRYLLY